MTNTDLIKGFRDYTGEEAEKREAIRKILVDIFERYGFEPAETPIIESEEFVVGENPNDEAVSDIFRLKDKGERKLALKYEQTFSLKRLMQNKKLPYKRYTIGPVFRDEPVTGNRTRQFVQCDVDIINATIKDEAEIAALTIELMKSLGIEAVLYFNNRKLLNEILESQGIKKKEEVIREIDKLDKLSVEEVKKNLEKYGAEKVVDIIKKPKEYLKKYASYKEIEEFEDCCKLYGIKVQFLPSLARGLSYYNRTVFEVKTKEIKETITAGGSYIFNEIQSTGISFGLERLSILAKINLEKEKYLIISLGEDKQAIKIAQQLREKSKSASVYYGKPSKALEYANSYKINKVIFVGETEVKSKKFKVKDMNSGKETKLNL